MEVSRIEYFMRPTSRPAPYIVMVLRFSANFPILLLKFTLSYFNQPSAAYWWLIVRFEEMFLTIFWSYRYANRGAVNWAPIPYLCRANTYTAVATPGIGRPYVRSPLPLAPSPRSLSEFTWAAAPAANKSQNQGGVGCWGKSEREREGSSFRWQP